MTGPGSSGELRSPNAGEDSGRCPVRRRTGYERLMSFLRVQDMFVRPALCPPPDGRVPADVVISPARSFIDRVAEIGSDGVIPEKSIFGRQRHIHLQQLMSDEGFLGQFPGGLYVKQYLAPWDPHAVVFPTACLLERLVHEDGKALPLLFMKGGDVQNERLSAFIRTDQGMPIVMILVGSFLVRSVNTICHVGEHYDRSTRFGHFFMGSSIILLFPRLAAQPLCREGTKVEYGSPIARLRG